jgi:hypothetical protein
MTSFETLVLILYFFILSILTVYGWHRYYLVYLYSRHRDNAAPPPPPAPDPLPVVTVQLPIYNEMYVAERLIEAVCRLDYPADRLEIQVLDDSTDETQAIAELAARRAASGGSTSSTSTAPIGAASRRARSRRDCGGRAASSSPSSTPTSCRRPTSCGARSATSPIPPSAWCRRGGGTSTRATRC